MRKKVLLIGPILTQSGYGVHSRQIFEWLEKLPNIDLTVEVLQWGKTTWLINPELQNGLIKRILEYLNLVEKYKISFAVLVANQINELIKNYMEKNSILLSVHSKSSCILKFDSILFRSS